MNLLPLTSEELARAEKLAQDMVAQKWAFSQCCDGCLSLHENEATVNKCWVDNASDLLLRLLVERSNRISIMQSFGIEFDGWQLSLDIDVMQGRINKLQDSKPIQTNNS